MPPHRPPLQEGYRLREQEPFYGYDCDGTSTVFNPRTALESNDSSTYYGPSTHTHVPPSTSATSSGVHEVSPSSMDTEYEQLGISSADFINGEGPSINTDPAGIKGPMTRKLSPEELEQERDVALMMFWGTGNNGRPLQYTEALLCLQNWMNKKLEPILRQTLGQSGNAMRSAVPQNRQRKGPHHIYFCLRCSQGKSYSTKGAIERHLNEKHTQHEFYVCRFCTEIIFRRDKVVSHYKDHFPDGTLSAGEIARLKRFTNKPAPTQCMICQKSVCGWKELMNCLVQDCCYSQDLGDNSEDSGQNQGHGGDGGDFGGFGNGNGSAPGPANSGGGNGMLPQGGINNQFGVPSYHGPASGSCGNSYCSLAEDTEGDTSPVESIEFATDDDDAEEEEEEEETFESDPHTMSPNVRQSPMGNKDQKLKKPHQNDQDIQPRKCRQCGHIFGSCSNCPQEVTTTVECHNCNQNRQPQLQISPFFIAYDEYKDTACNGLSDGISKKFHIHEAVKAIDRNHTRKTQQHLHEPSGKLIWSPSKVTLMMKLASSLQEHLLLGEDDCKKVRGDLGSRSLQHHMISSHYEDDDQSFPTVCYLWNVGIRRLNIPSDFGTPRIQTESCCIGLTPLDWTEKFLFLARWDHALVDQIESQEFTNLTGFYGRCTKPISSIEFTNDKTIFEGSDSGKVLSNHPTPLVRNCRSLNMSDYDVMIRTHKMLEHIRLNPPSTVRSSMRQLHCCHESLDAIDAELAGNRFTDLDSERELNPPKDRHKRLSALRTRLRVVAMLLMLQTTVTSMRQSQMPAEDDSLECSLDRKSMDRFSSTLRSGSIIPCTVLRLLESLLCRMRDAWKHIQHLDVVSCMVNPDEESTHIITILSILIMRLCDFASCPMMAEPIIANDNLDVFDMRTMQTEIETSLVSVSGSDEPFQNGVLISGHATKVVFQTLLEPPEHSTGNLCLPPVSHDVDFSINGDSKQQILEVIRQAIENGWQMTSDEYV